MIAWDIPTSVSLSSMRPLARLPLFFCLSNKRVIVAGGTAAIWKAALLAAAGATVHLFPDELARRLALPRDEDMPGSIEVYHRTWSEKDFHQTVLAVCAFEDESEIERFAALARASGGLVNAVDRPAHCDFTFGAIVNRSPVVVGISTDGSAPALATAVRARLEAMIPHGLARWAETAREWRARLGLVSRVEQQRFWSTFACRSIANANREPAETDFDELLQLSRSNEPVAGNGSITFVDAGLGDPELLTLRALRVLNAADVIVVDDLVSSEILDFARREAKRLVVDEPGHHRSCKQDEIYAVMVTLARNGQRVVRLMGGGSLTSARLGDELVACRAANVYVEVVPEIHAAQGLASYFGISRT